MHSCDSVDKIMAAKICSGCQLVPCPTLNNAEAFKGLDSRGGMMTTWR